MNKPQNLNSAKIPDSETRKINFLIMGTQKGGTSALAKFLSEHEQIGMAAQKEVHFFDHDKFFDPLVNYQDYHDYFSDVISSPQYQVIGEATPIYMYCQNAPQRIAQYNPKMKLIFILRNPLDRAYSHWTMNRRRGLEFLSFSEAIRLENERLKVAPEGYRFYSYVERGYYSQQIKKIMELFPRKQMLFLKNEDLKVRHIPTLNRVYDFLGVKRLNQPQYFIKFNFYQPMEAWEQEYLAQKYARELNELESLLNWDCSEWKSLDVISKETDAQLKSEQFTTLSFEEQNILSVSYYKALAQLEFKQGNLEAAIYNCQQAIKLEPDNSAHHLFLGNIYGKHKHLAAAKVSYKKAMALAPEDFWICKNLGNIITKLKQFDQAIHIYQKAIKLQPDNPEIYRLLGNVQHKQGSLDAAIINCQQAIKINSKYIRGYLDLADILIGQGKLEEAVKVCHQAIKLNPNHPGIYNSLGNIQRQQGNQENAIFAYRRSLELNPKQFQIYKILGSSLFKLGQTEAAIKAYTKAITLDPKHPSIYVALGNIHLKCEHIEQAITAYQKAIELNPQQPFGVYRSLGDALSKQGQISAAKAAYTKAAQLKS